MRKKQPVALVVGSFFAAVALATAESPVSIRIATPSQVRMAPLGRAVNLVLIIRMEKHERNWDLDISCDGIDGGNYVSSGKSFWNGEKQDEIFPICFNLPSATYNCEAVLRRKEDGKMKEFRDYLKIPIL